MTHDQTRRTVLKAGVAAGSLAVVGSMAGCSGLLGGGGGASYSSWLYAPGTVGESDHYSFSITDHQDIRDNEQTLEDEDRFDSYESREDSFPLDQMNVSYDEVNETISVGRGGSFGGGGGSVVTGSFSESDVIDELEDNEQFSDESEHEGYTIFSVSSQGSSTARQAIGVSGSTAVAANAQGPETGAEEVLEVLIDTDNGDEERYTEDNDDMNVVVNEVGSGTFVNGSTADSTDETNVEQGAFGGQVGSGSRITINGDTSDVKSVLVFDSSDDIDMGDIEDYTDTDRFDRFDDISTSQSGRAVTITASADTEDVA
jgi:hypothetical protein